MVYTFKNTCVEAPSIPYDDGVTTIYLYTKGTVGCPGKSLQNMLKYIENTTEENAIDDNLKSLQNIVEHVKMDREVGVRYMKSWEAEAYAKEEGKQEGKREGLYLKSVEIARNLLDILDPATIALKTGLTEEEVRNLKEV